MLINVRWGGNILLTLQTLTNDPVSDCEVPSNCCIAATVAYDVRGRNFKVLNKLTKPGSLRIIEKILIHTNICLFDSGSSTKCIFNELLKISRSEKSCKYLPVMNFEVDGPFKRNTSTAKF